MLIAEHPAEVLSALFVWVLPFNNMTLVPLKDISTTLDFIDGLLTGQFEALERIRNRSFTWNTLMWMQRRALPPQARPQSNFHLNAQEDRQQNS